MRMQELRQKYLEGKIEKKVFFQLMRENYTHCLPEIQKVLRENKECETIILRKDDCILERSDGVKLYFDFNQALCRAEGELFMDGDPEKDDMVYIGKYLSEIGTCTVLDIGANVGLFSLALLKKHKDCLFYLFEPIPTTFDWLKKTAELNTVDSRQYRPYNCGMSDKEGFFDFYVPSSNESASLKANEDDFYTKKTNSFGEYLGTTDIDKVSCHVDTIDNFVDEHGIENIGFIKIDVEGNEKFVLEGAQNTLRKFRPIVYAELLRKHAKRFGYHPNEVIKYMGDIGYRCTVLSGGGVIEVNEITELTKETNFFFEPKL